MVTQTKTIALTVELQEGDFRIVSLDAITVKPGEDVVFTIDCTPLLGFNRPVKFTISGGPVGTVFSWPVGDTWQPGQPEPDNIQCTVAIPLDNSLMGTYSLFLVGQSL